MKILHFHPSLSGGGIEAMICGLANEMCRQGHDVTIGTIFKPKDTDIFCAPFSSTAVSTDVRIVFPAPADAPVSGNNTAILCGSSEYVPYMFENGPCSRFDGRPITVSDGTDQSASVVSLPEQPAKINVAIKYVKAEAQAKILNKIKEIPRIIVEKINNKNVNF